MYLESENTKFIRLQPSKKGKAHFFFAFLKNYCLSVLYALFYSPFLGLPTRFARVGLCRSSQVCSALRRKAPGSGASRHCFLSLSLQDAEKRYSSLRSLCFYMSPPPHPFAGFLKGIPRGSWAILVQTGGAAACWPQARTATTRTLVRSSTTKGSNRCAAVAEGQNGLAMRRGGRRPDRTKRALAKFCEGPSRPASPKA